MTRKQLVGGGRFGYAAHVVVKRYQTGRVVLNRDLHHFPGMNTGAIDRAVEERQWLRQAGARCNAERSEATRLGVRRASR